MRTETPQAEAEMPVKYSGAKGYFTAAIWSANLTIVLIGQLVLLPMFEEFGTTLPTSTRMLHSLAGFSLLVSISIVILLVVFAMRRGPRKYALLWLFTLSGICVFVGYSLAMLLPLLALMQNLS